MELITALSREIGDKARVSENYVRKFLRSRDCHVILALEKGKPIGILSYSIRPSLYHAAPSFYIEDLFVAREHREMGAASALLRRASELAKKVRCIEISVSTGFWNRRAIGLYRKHGLRDRSLLLEAHLKSGTTGGSRRRQK